LRKANALYYEFEEIGLNRQLGYESPADIVDKYPRFYWNNVSLHHPGRYRLPSGPPRPYLDLVNASDGIACHHLGAAQDALNNFCASFPITNFTST
jgi:hypothetical protein